MSWEKFQSISNPFHKNVSFLSFAGKILVYAADADIYEIDEEVDTAELIAVKTKIVAALKRFIGRGEE